MPQHDHRVLIVEDDAECREAVGAVLESEGYRVTMAPDGQAAIDQLREGLDPCVILLDLMMPVKDGWWFRYEQLRDPDLGAIPVVVMSGAGRVQEKAQQLGLQDYIEKPVDPGRLLNMLGRYCERE
jgi:CheY-like chemotaxis protein